jgi:hypothetical protein
MKLSTTKIKNINIREATDQTATKIAARVNPEAKAMRVTIKAASTQKTKHHKKASRRSNIKFKSSSQLPQEENFAKSQVDSMTVSRYAEIKENKPESPVKKRFRLILEHSYTQTVLSLITVYVLFADDIKMITTTQDADPIFSIICISIMILFFIEFLISSIVVENYFLGFYFWLDLVSILSMVLDVHWFYLTLVNAISGGSSNAKSIAAIAKAGRGAKIGSRAVRILRILRIIRLVRITKLYKASEKILEKNLLKDGNDKKKIAMVDEANKGENKIEMPEESKVGRKLSDLTTRRVIILVLSMMIGIILFNSSFYYNVMSSMDFGIKIFEEFPTSNDPNFNLTFNIYVNEHLNISTPIIWAQAGNLSYGNFNDTINLRQDEKIVSDTACDGLDLPRDYDAVVI